MLQYKTMWHVSFLTALRLSVEKLPVAIKMIWGCVHI